MEHNNLTRVPAAIIFICFIFQAEPIKVCVTGAAGQIAYSLLYSLANGDVFGKNQVCGCMVAV